MQLVIWSVSWFVNKSVCQGCIKILLKLNKRQLQISFPDSEFINSLISGYFKLAKKPNKTIRLLDPRKKLFV